MSPTNQRLGYDGTVMIKCRICGKDLYRMLWSGFSTVIGMCCQDPEKLGAIKSLDPTPEESPDDIIYYPEEDAATREEVAGVKTKKKRSKKKEKLTEEEAEHVGEDDKAARWSEILKRRKKQV